MRLSSLRQNTQLWTPQSCEKVIVWYDCSRKSNITLVSGLVSQLTPVIGGSAFNLLQSDPAKRPPTTDYSIQFQGVEGLIAATTTGTTWDLCVSFKPQFAWPTTAGMVASTGGTTQAASNGILLLPLGQARAGLSGVSTNYTTTFNLTLGNPAVMYLKGGSNTGVPAPANQLYANGNALSKAAGGATSTMSSTTTMGARWNGTTFDLPLRGEVYDMMILSSTATTEERQKLEGYMAWKMYVQAPSLGVILPATHPYKSAPPMIRR